MRYIGINQDIMEIGWHGAKYGNFKAKPFSIHHTEHLGNGLGAEIKRM